MDLSRFFLILILTLLLFGTGAYALDSKIPKEGTVFVGENDLDISDCNVRSISSTIHAGGNHVYTNRVGCVWNPGGGDSI